MVSKNAITHGIFAQKDMLSEQDALELEELAANLIDDLRPATQIEAALVDRIIQAIWRQRKLQRAEAAQIALAQLPFNVITEVNIALKLPDQKWKNSNDLKEASNEEIKRRQKYEKFREELSKIDISAAANDISLLKNSPNILANIQNKASKLGVDMADFVKDSAAVEEYLNHFKTMVEQQYQDNIERQLVRAIGEIVKQTKMIPKPSIMDKLMKYQVQLDNDLYKALAELRKAREYRLKTIEAQPIEN